MKRVLFLYNGGTIGHVTEVRNGQAILVPPKNSEVFKSACEPILGRIRDDMEIDFEFMTSKDSTNINPQDWENLILRIKRAQDDEDYDAVAMVHGTDTLAYTATSLALALHGKTAEKNGLRIPVCITGAQNPIYYTGSDAKFNLENMFRTIDKSIELGISDILVNFWDRVLLGCRAVKMSERKFDAFQSPSYPDVGYIDSNGIHIDTKLVRLKEHSDGELNISPKFAKGVVSLSLSPGTDPEIILNFISNNNVSALV